MLIQLLREWPPGFGGVERTAHEWAQAFKHSDIFCLATPSVQPDPLPVAYGRWCLPILRIAKLRIPLPIGSFWNLVCSPQHLHGHLPSPAVLFLVLLLQWLQPRRSFSLHWHAFLQGWANRAYQLIALKLLRWRQLTVITTSPVLKQALITRGLKAQQVLVLACCLSAPGEALARHMHENRQICAAPVKAGSNPINIVCIGRLDSYKRIDWVINAVVLCRPHFRLSIIGDGPDRAQLELLVSDKCADQFCKFLGKLPEAKKFDALGKADLLVLASHNCHEAFGIAQLEAMACGVPALALACPNSGSTWVSKVPVMPTWDHPGALALADVLRSFSADRKLLKLAGQQAKDRYENLFCRRLWQEQLLSLGIAN